ncbi:glycerol-3-phosphate dehydrogenase [soil metagenome]
MQNVQRDGVDLLVVGGGVNGCGIARDAAGRGLSVMLVERDDLAGHTSSGSTKLVHGGLRYLEYYEFALVRKALAERERLLRSAPHIMWPLRFVLPHEPHLRPVWMIRAGLFLYDHLAKREWLPASVTLDLRRDVAGQPLRPSFTRGFEYSDGWVDDARLVVLCAVDARRQGADIRTRTRLVQARRDGDHWLATIESEGRSTTVRARSLVNASGPWAAELLGAAMPPALAPRHGLRLVRGSHLVLDRLFDHDRAYIFQNADGRIVFAIPYERDFTLLGTTDSETGSPADPAASQAEIDYLLEVARRHFAQPVDRSMIRHSYSAVRPLLEGEGTAAAVTRDYSLELDRDGAPLLNVWGGKITTFRRLAEEAVDQLADALAMPAKAWTADATLPGGDIPALAGAGRSSDPQQAFHAFVQSLERRFADRPAALVQRLARLYGTEAVGILDRPGLLVPGVPQSELEHAWTREWARTGDDFLWRRTKLGLHLDRAAQDAVTAWFDARRALDADRSSAAAS